MAASVISVLFLLSLVNIDNVTSFQTQGKALPTFISSNGVRLNGSQRHRLSMANVPIAANIPNIPETQENVQVEERSKVKSVVVGVGAGVLVGRLILSRKKSQNDSNTDEDVSGEEKFNEIMGETKSPPSSSSSTIIDQDPNLPDKISEKATEINNITTESAEKVKLAELANEAEDKAAGDALLAKEEEKKAAEAAALAKAKEEKAAEAAAQAKAAEAAAQAKAAEAAAQAKGTEDKKDSEVTTKAKDRRKFSFTMTTKRTSSGSTKKAAEVTTKAKDRQKYSFTRTTKRTSSSSTGSTSYLDNMNEKGISATPLVQEAAKKNRMEAEKIANEAKLARIAAEEAASAAKAEAEEKARIAAEQLAEKEKVRIAAEEESEKVNTEAEVVKTVTKEEKDVGAVEETELYEEGLPFMSDEEWFEKNGWSFTSDEPEKRREEVLAKIVDELELVPEDPADDDTIAPKTSYRNGTLVTEFPPDPVFD